MSSETVVTSCAMMMLSEISRSETKDDWEGEKISGRNVLSLEAIIFNIVLYII